ncbi:MAG: GspE/PulE family protein [SAR202 cluster bacterium]|nr:GspE/PulE family protein [SAR202 cluster bacterium]
MATGTVEGNTNREFENKMAGILQDAGVVTPSQLERAQQHSLQDEVGILEALVDEGAVSRETIITLLSFQLKIPVVDLKTAEVDPEAVMLLPENFARDKKVMPVGFEPDGSLKVVTQAPNDFQVLSQIATITGRQARYAIALTSGLSELIERTYADLPASEGLSQPEIVPDMARIEAAGILGQDVTQLTAVQAVEMVCLQAIKRKSSDVHFVPSAEACDIMFRLDGVLQKVATIPVHLHESMIARIKVLADMDIAETRRPQDGSFNLELGERDVDFRVSSVAIAWGEMMVVRILDRSDGIMRLEDLGLDRDELSKWRQLLSLPFGMVLVSGPTGSGKTTTLYSSVTELVRDRGNIMTIEDPIEYRVESLHQIEVNRQAGVDFPAGLRAIMRLDPDVILVGEIRDVETAKTAVDAALTGQLVLASIHSNDAASAFTRLIDIGIEPYLAATAVVGVAGQRLVRKVCPHCVVATDLDTAEKSAYEAKGGQGVDGFVSGTGCNFCGFTGFLGRTGVFEVLAVTEDTRALVASGASGQVIRRQAINEGMNSLHAVGMIKAEGGITTVNEVLSRVFFFE